TPPGTRERFVKNVQGLVQYENTIFGPPPLQQYTFLFNIGFPGGDGMEHLYSTQIQNGRPWTDTAAVLPGISSAAHALHVPDVEVLVRGGADAGQHGGRIGPGAAAVLPGISSAAHE